jgi:hypothetical protein
MFQLKLVFNTNVIKIPTKEPEPKLCPIDVKFMCGSESNADIACRHKDLDCTNPKNLIYEPPYFTLGQGLIDYFTKIYR